MRSLVFDTGPVITLTLNNLMWILNPLKKQFGGSFYITESVRHELIEKPLDIKRFKFEALHTLHYIRAKDIQLHQDTGYKEKAKELLKLANSIFRAHGRYIQILHIAEIEVIALAKQIKASAIVVDERTTIEILEDPEVLKEHLKRKLHSKVSVNKANLGKFRKMTEGIDVIRSVDLAMVAYEMGLLDRYLPDNPYNKEMLIDAVLWGLKLNGCAIGEDEIKSIIDYAEEL